MKASQHSQALREIDPVPEHRGNPGVDTILHRVCSDEQDPPWNPAESSVPDEGAFETFVDGAGI